MTSRSVLIGVIVLSAALIAVPIILCGGLAIITQRGVQEAAREKIDERQKLKSDAWPHAVKDLERLGIVEISNDAMAFEHEGDTVFSGTGRDRQGKLHHFFVTYKVATFGNETQWQLKEAVVDGSTDP